MFILNVRDDVHVGAEIAKHFEREDAGPRGAVALRLDSFDQHQQENFALHGL